MNAPASKVWNRDFLVLWDLTLILPLFRRFITFDPARDTPEGLTDEGHAGA